MGKEGEVSCMSIFVAEMLPDGIVFAADKNLTLPFVDRTGTALGGVQELGSKVLRWPRSTGLLGYVGLAEVGNQSMYDWLYDFIGDHIGFTDPAPVAASLRDRLQLQLGPNAEATIVQFAAYAIRDGCIIPEYWSITNVPGQDDDGNYLPPSATFTASERLLGVHLKDQGVKNPNGVRNYLRMRAEGFIPFWFHQGNNLHVFNTLEEAARLALRATRTKGLHQPPSSLAEWEQYAMFWVLTYGAYFDSFGGPGERFVGGGADVLSIPWPDAL
jgi:hypothetical protein